MRWSQSTYHRRTHGAFVRTHVPFTYEPMVGRERPAPSAGDVRLDRNLGQNAAQAKYMFPTRVANWSTIPVAVGKLAAQFALTHATVHMPTGCTKKASATSTVFRMRPQRGSKSMQPQSLHLHIAVYFRNLVIPPLPAPCSLLASAHRLLQCSQPCSIARQEKVDRISSEARVQILSLLRVPRTRSLQAQMLPIHSTLLRFAQGGLVSHQVLSVPLCSQEPPRATCIAAATQPHPICIGAVARVLPVANTRLELG